MNPNINERLLLFFDSLNVSYRQVEKTLNFSNGTIGKLKKGVFVGSDKLEKISQTYKQLNPIWLLKGTGEMLIGKEPSVVAEPPATYDKTALEMIRDLSAENALLKKEIEELKKGKKED